MTFQITDKYSLSTLDDRNWVIERKMAIDARKRGKIALEGLQEPSTAVFGYYSTLEGAKKDLAELLAKEAVSFEELERWVNKIKEI